jgi:hypothetical protein
VPASTGVAGAVLFSAWLGAPQLAYVWEHRVGGSAVFPGAGFMEMAGAAARAALDPSSAGGGGAAAGRGGLGVTVEAVTIRAPLLLPARRGRAPVLQCSLGLEDGALAISSAGVGEEGESPEGPGTPAVVHVTARVAAVFWAAAA